MMNKNAIIFDVTIPIYDTYILFCLGTDVDSITKQIITKWKVTDSMVEARSEILNVFLSSCRGFSTKLLDVNLVYIKNARDSNTVAHEIFHAVYKILTDKGIICSDNSEEAYAYLIGFVTEQFYKKCRKFID